MSPTNRTRLVKSLLLPKPRFGVGGSLLRPGGPPDTARGHRDHWQWLQLSAPYAELRCLQPREDKLLADSSPPTLVRQGSSHHCLCRASPSGLSSEGVILGPGFYWRVLPD